MNVLRNNAAQSCGMTEVYFLLGADVNMDRGYGKTALVYAAGFGYLDVVNALIAAGKRNGATYYSSEKLTIQCMFQSAMSNFASRCS